MGLKDAKVFDDEAKALTWAKATERRMKRGEWTAPEKRGAVRLERTFRQAAEDYLASDQFEAKKNTTKHGERHKLKPAIDALGGRVLTELNVTDIENHLASRALVRPKRVVWKEKRAAEAGVELPPEVSARKLSKDQRRLELAAISAVFNFAREQKWVTDNPTWHVKRPGSTSRNSRVDDAEIGSILDFMIGLERHGDDVRPYMFFSLLFSSLARPGELAQARKDWLRADPPQIILPGDAAKNTDARAIVIAESYYKVLQQYLAGQPSGCPFLFGTLGRDGKSWRPYNYAVPWDKARKALGLTGLVPHMARHEGVSRLFERTDLSDGQIAGLSGHRTPQALWRYKHLRNELQRGTIEDLHRDMMHAVDRHITQLHPSRGLKPGERLGENRHAKRKPAKGQGTR